MVWDPQAALSGCPCLGDSSHQLANLEQRSRWCCNVYLLWLVRWLHLGSPLLSKRGPGTFSCKVFLRNKIHRKYIACLYYLFKLLLQTNFQICILILFPIILQGVFLICTAQFCFLCNVHFDFIDSFHRRFQKILSLFSQIYLFFIYFKCVYNVIFSLQSNTKL